MASTLAGLSLCLWPSPVPVSESVTALRSFRLEGRGERCGAVAVGVGAFLCLVGDSAAAWGAGGGTEDGTVLLGRAGEGAGYRLGVEAT